MKSVCVCVHVGYVPVWKLPNTITDFFLKIHSLLLNLKYGSPHVLLNSAMSAFAFGRVYDAFIFCSLQEIWA